MADERSMRRSGQPAILPRDRPGATRAVAYFMLAAFALIIGLSIAVPSYRGPTPATAAITYVTGIALGILGLVCLLRPDWLPEGFWVSVPILAIAVIGALNYLTKDAGVSAQLFFLWPALYAATFLRHRLVVGVLLGAFTTDFILVKLVVGLTQAIRDTVSLVIAVSLASIIIILLRSRVADLLAVLEGQAQSDTLTGVANRRAFELGLDRAVAHAGRTGHPITVLTIDLDHFKEINDSHGHRVGDEALVMVAGALTDATRGADLVARLGGDEFVALLPDCTASDAAIIAGKIQAALRIRWPASRKPLTLSIGAAAMPDDARTAEQLLVASDAALYEAKARGRNRIALAADLTPPA
jgi:diguanylate cyclase (GGDEF)-like protein